MNVGIKQRILQLQANAGLGGSGGGGGGWSGHRHGMAEVSGWGAAERGMSNTRTTAQRPAIIERNANANAHVQALSAGRYHGCLGVCSGCCAGARTSSRDDAQRRLRAACAETAAAEHLTTGASTATALRCSTTHFKACFKPRTRL